MKTHKPSSQANRVESLLEFGESRKGKDRKRVEKQKKHSEGEELLCWEPWLLESLNVFYNV